MLSSLVRHEEQYHPTAAGACTTDYYLLITYILYIELNILASQFFLGLNLHHSTNTKNVLVDLRPFAVWELVFDVTGAFLRLIETF